MPYTVKEITNPDQWDAFVMSGPYTLFVQSADYAAFYALLGESSWIFGIFDEHNTLIGGSLVLSTHAKRGNFLYLPYGPVIALNGKEEHAAFHTLTETLVSFARANNYRFIRVSPFFEASTTYKNMFAQEGYRSAPMHILAETTWMLDITPDEQTLFASMKKNHRNLIRRCERDGVRVEKRTDDAALDILHTLLDATKKRHNFTPFSRSYIDNEFKQFATHGRACIFVAYLPDGTIDSCAIIMFYGNTAVYRHSGSLNKNKKLPTSYLVQWHVIGEAKKRGMKWYNFWGIAPDDAPQNHPFKGITHFKTGFGGEKKELLHCQDLVVSRLYWINWIVERLRSMRRGFKY